MWHKRMKETANEKTAGPFPDSTKSRRLAGRHCDSKAARFGANEQVPPAATRRNSRTQGNPSSSPKCIQIKEGTLHATDHQNKKQAFNTVVTLSLLPPEHLAAAILKTAAVLCAYVHVTRKPQ